MLLTQITNKESIIGIGEFYLSQLRTIAHKTASQLLKNWSREAGFSAVLYLVRTKNIKQVVDSFLRGFKKRDQMYTTAMALAPGGALALLSQDKNFYFWAMGPFPY